MNRICLIGRITKDPELKTTKNNKECVQFTVAVARNKNKEGEVISDFIYCIAWNQTAKFMANYIKKGYNLAIDGRLQINQYQKDGQNVTSAQVICDSVNSLTTRAELNNQQGQPKQAYQQKPNNYNKPKQNTYNSQPSNTQAQKPQNNQSFNVNVVDDELPF